MARFIRGKSRRTRMEAIENINPKPAAGWKPISPLELISIVDDCQSILYMHGNREALRYWFRSPFLLPYKDGCGKNIQWCVLFLILYCFSVKVILKSGSSSIIEDIKELCRPVSPAYIAIGVYLLQESTTADKCLLLNENLLLSLLSQLPERYSEFRAALKEVFHAHDNGREHRPL